MAGRKGKGAEVGDKGVRGGADFSLAWKAVARELSLKILMSDCFSILHILKKVNFLNSLYHSREVNQCRDLLMKEDED